METVKAGKINIPVIKGDTGEAGKIDSISIEMIDTNENPRVDNLGTKSNAKLKFYIPKGTSITNLSINEFGYLIVNLSDGQIINCGKVRGEQGEPGEKGEKGENGEPGNIEETGIFYWDGLSSDDNPQNIELWQKIYDKSREQTVMVFATNQTSSSNYYNCVFLINKSIIKDTITTVSIKSLLNQAGNGNNAQGSNVTLYYGLVNLSLSKGTIQKVQKINWGNINTSHYLPTNTTTVNNYTPTYDYHPAPKKYVDDSIKNNLSNITGLTPEIVSSLPSPEEADINTIYLIPDPKATAENKFIEYLFINGNPEPIGRRDIDLTDYAKKNEVPLIYFFDGQDSIQNSENLQLFQEIVEKHLEGKDILIAVIHNEQTYMYYFSASASLQSIDQYNYYSINSNLFVTRYSEATITNSILMTNHQILIYIEEGQVTNVYCLTKTDYREVEVLDCNLTSDDQYFIPEYNSQPASKGYADKLLANSNIYSTIREIVVGIWEDSDGNQKNIYQKVVPFGALPNSNYKEVNHNISNIDRIISKELSTDGQSISIPNITVTKDIIAITTTDNKSSYINNFVTLKYTKTTD